MRNIAIITGASSGLGREFVKHIDAGEAGPIDELWVIARRAERLEALERTCATPTRSFSLDLTDPASFDALDEAVAAAGDINVALLINNAGFGSFGDFALQSHVDTASMVKLLMQAPVELMYRMLPFMHGGSRIINIASVAAFVPQPRLAVYAAAKRFILDLTRALDAELGEVDIHATAVCPKFMKTEFLDAPGDADAAQRMTAIGFEQATDVVRAALTASRAGKSLCIPSLDMRAYYAASRVLPYKALLAIERRLGVL